ncbi:MAG: class I SAM-dependent methyltransferase [Pedobacter sp.]|nr:MAG: class I SAM-dependent methyltransferase [Pedobacter sp.]
MINITCPICLNEKTQLNTILFKVKTISGEEYEIRECDKCLHHYTYFDHEIDISSYYDEKDYTVRDTRESIFFKIQKAEYNLVLHKIKQHVHSHPASLLDFGSGKGLFLHFAKQKGFNVKGIESSMPRATYAKTNFDLDINTEYYTVGSVFGKQFDVLTMFHVLEHIHLSNNFLSNLINENLKDEGLLVIEVPNFDSWQSKWAGNRWMHLDVPRHLSHFKPKRIQELVEENNCKIIATSYFSLHLGIVGMVQTIFSWFGYKGFLIADLKQQKTVLLMVSLLLVLPFAILLELFSAMFNKGGIIRLYAVKQSDK